MILDLKKTTVAYRCPQCGAVTTSIVGVFSLNGKLFKLKCSCGGSHMTVEKQNDGHITLTVPCVACPRPHIYNLTENVFFGSDVFVVPCSLCGIDICFLGKEEEVAKAVDYSNKELLTMLGDASIEGLKNKEEGDSIDPQVAEIVTYVVHEMNDEGVIYCGCGQGKGEYECTVHSDFVTVRCNKCHKSATIPTDSTIAAYDFLNADKLTLS